MYKLTGPHMTVAAACASSNMAMSRALDMVRYGRRPMVLTGGADMPLCPTVLTAWAAMRILADSEDPQRACLPFHRRRNGFSLGEGAAMFLFEDLEHARGRGARIYAEVAGYGENSDALHITRSDPEREAACIAEALRDAGVTPDQVGYINAHGTATKVNDANETEAIKIAFGERAYRVPISSTKSVVGHTMGASGAIELAAVLGAIRNQVAPPTANLDSPDPKCDLDFVPCSPKPARIECALSNSFAFGGANSVLVVRRMEESA
jgi:3-oxoacyl-(acyl-carrier-protein) synthase